MLLPVFLERILCIKYLIIPQLNGAAENMQTKPTVFVLKTGTFFITSTKYHQQMFGA